MLMNFLSGHVVCGPVMTGVPAQALARLSSGGFIFQPIFICVCMIYQHISTSPRFSKETQRKKFALAAALAALAAAVEGSEDEELKVLCCGPFNAEAVPWLWWRAAPKTIRTE